MPESSQKYGILLLEKTGKTRPLKLADDLARAANILRLDAIIQLRSSHSFILSMLNEENARNAADFLVSRGIAAIPQPIDAFDIQYGSGIIRNADPLPEGLLIQNQDTGKETTLPWNLLRGVFAIHRLAAIRKAFSSIQLSRHYGYDGSLDSRFGESWRPTGKSPVSIGFREGVWAMLGHILSEPSLGERILFGETGGTDNTKNIGDVVEERPALKPNSLDGGPEDDVIILIMGNDPVVISLIERSGFNYDFLGERITPSSKLNFPPLVKDICRFAKPLYVNNGIVDVIKNDTLPKEKVEGKLVSRWILEHVLALNLLDNGLVSTRVAEAIGDDESMLVYLD